MNVKTVMLTGAGGGGTIAVIKSLKKQGYRVVAADASSHAVGLYLADVGYKIPFGNSEFFLPELEAIIKKEKVDVLIPLVDEELLKVFSLPQKFPGLKLLLPKKEFVEIGLDKWKTFSELKKLGFPVPDSILIQDYREFPESFFPRVIKPTHGHGGRGFAVLKNNTDFKRYMQENKGTYEEFILQEKLEGTETTTSVPVTLDGRLLAVVPKEVVARQRSTRVGVSRKNEEITRLCEEIVEKFTPNGPFNVQCMLTSTGPKIFEINPRFSTTVALTMAAGVDEISLLLDTIAGKTVGKLSFKEDLVMLRYEEQFYLDEKDLVN